MTDRAKMMLSMGFDKDQVVLRTWIVAPLTASAVCALRALLPERMVSRKLNEQGSQTKIYNGNTTEWRLIEPS